MAGKVNHEKAELPLIRTILHWYYRLATANSGLQANEDVAADETSELYAATPMRRKEPQF